MRLSEFLDAVDGFNELESERLKWQFYTTRKICFWIAVAQGVTIDGRKVEESDIMAIKDLDEELAKLHRESLPIVQIQVDGADQSK